MIALDCNYSHACSHLRGWSRLILLKDDMAKTKLALLPTIVLARV